jgi:hypothetical protein
MGLKHFLTRGKCILHFLSKFQSKLFSSPRVINSQQENLTPLSFQEIFYIKNRILGKMTPTPSSLSRQGSISFPHVVPSNETHFTLPNKLLLLLQHLLWNLPNECLLTWGSQSPFTATFDESVLSWQMHFICVFCKQSSAAEQTLPCFHPWIPWAWVITSCPSVPV